MLVANDWRRVRYVSLFFLGQVKNAPTEVTKQREVYQKIPSCRYILEYTAKIEYGASNCKNESGNADQPAMGVQESENEFRELPHLILSAHKSTRVRGWLVGILGGCVRQHGSESNAIQEC
jgi:hypothetical protein